MKDRQLEGDKERERKMSMKRDRYMDGHVERQTQAEERILTPQRETTETLFTKWSSIKDSNLSLPSIYLLSFVSPFFSDTFTGIYLKLLH